MKTKRLTLGTLSLVSAAGLGLLLSGGAAAAPSIGSMTVPIDRQDYVTSVTTTNPTDGSTVDPYDADPSSIHVAVNGGEELARSFVHLALDYLPPGATASNATMRLFLTQQSDASNSGVYPAYNVNTSAAIIEACALTTQLPAKFDQQHPPAYDCQHGSAVGKPDAAGDEWTFPLKDLVAYWHDHGNTGAALVPIGSGDPSQTWGVAFYKSRSTSTVDYVLAAPPAHPTPSPTAVLHTGGSTAAGSSVPVPSAVPTLSNPPVTTSPAPVGNGAAPTIAPSQAAPAAAAPAGHPSNQPVWPWVLVGCVALTAASLAVAHRGALLAVLRTGGVPGLALVRSHPRAYALASASLAWGLVFSTYTVVTTHNPPAGSDLAANASNGNGSATGPNGVGGAPTPGVTAAAGGSTPGTGLGSNSTGPSTAGGQVGGSSPAADPAATELKGAGTWRTINGVQVFFPAAGGPPVANLYHGADDTIGITSKQIELCAHAALTYGSAFHISASDLNVFWNWQNDHGGIFGRKVHADYENDNYDPGTAVQAAQTCKDLNTFFLLGGIGFDQIPAVRQWAEQNHEIYYHHIATIEGSAGLRYSFSALPTVEEMGRMFGQLAVQRFKGQKIGVLYRQSSNWEPGSNAFEQVVKAAGMQVVSYGVTINQGNYTQELAQLRTAGATVVFAWENALATTEMIKQAQGQNYHPAWLVFPFNLETNTLGASSLDQPILGVAAWDAYDPGYYGGGFASYASEIHEFEAQYKQYDPGADLTGDGGDLLFLNWEGQKQIADLLTRCGQQCTRNKFAGLLLAGYDRTVPPNCNINFGLTGDHHHGGYLANVLQVVKDPNGRPNFVPMQRCVSSVGG